MDNAIEENFVDSSIQRGVRKVGMSILQIMVNKTNGQITSSDNISQLNNVSTKNSALNFQTVGTIITKYVDFSNDATKENTVTLFIFLKILF